MNDGTITLIGTLSSIITLGIVLYQTKIFNTQLEIMKKQDEILSRHSILKIEGAYNKSKFQFDFTTKNIGSKGVTDLYWHILVPYELSENKQFKIPDGTMIGEIETIEHNSVKYKHFVNKVSEKIYPTRSVPIGNFPLPNTETTGTYSFLWQIIGEDGIFPEQNKFGELKLYT